MNAENRVEYSTNQRKPISKAQVLDGAGHHCLAGAFLDHGWHHEFDEAGLCGESDGADGISRECYLAARSRGPDLCGSLSDSEYRGTRCDPLNRLPGRGG